MEQAASNSRASGRHACLLASTAHPLNMSGLATFTLPPLQKYRGLMNFLSNVLREDGGFEYKKVGALRFCMAV